MNVGYVDGLLTVIVPVYNAECYLLQCLESIANQRYKNLEVILVDDGSNDSSGKICDDFCSKDNRFSVYHTENSGPSNARNFGLQKMKGQYLAFVDSDDYLEEDMYEKLIKFSNENNVGMVISNWIIHDEVYNEIRKSNIVVKEKVNGNEQKKVIFFNNEKGGGGYPWNRIINLAFVNNIGLFKRKKFIAGLSVYEDKCWLLDVLDCISEVSFLPECYLYHYFVRNNTLSRRKYSEKRKGVLESLNYMVDNLVASGQFSSSIRKQYINSVIGLFKDFCFDDVTYAKKNWCKYREKISYSDLSLKNVLKIMFIETVCFMKI